MKVFFISHKSEDWKIAKSLKVYIEKTFGTTCYLDAYDQGLRNLTPTALTERITKHLRTSSGLMVVFTQNTYESMWVPFEIGVAYERELPIGVYVPVRNGFKALLYDEIRTKIPEFLYQYPLLLDLSDVNQYIDVWQRKLNHMEEYLLYKTASAEANKAQWFIDTLKKRLGQNFDVHGQEAKGE